MWPAPPVRQLIVIQEPQTTWDNFRSKLMKYPGLVQTRKPDADFDQRLELLCNLYWIDDARDGRGDDIVGQCLIGFYLELAYLGSRIR